MKTHPPSTDHAQGDDLPDWLSANLVKELRQGLRSRAFVGVFLWVIVSMSVLLMIEVSLMGSGGNSRILENCENCFWLNVGVVLSVLLPLRGVSSGAEDMRASCLDLQRLAGRDPGRMVADKWLALCALSCILVIALLPFFLLRYNLGGVELVRELMMLIWTWVGAVVLAAVSILVATAPPAGRVIGCCVMLLSLPIVQRPALGIWLGDTQRPSEGALLFIWLLGAVVCVILALGGSAMRLAGDDLDTVSMLHDRAVYS